MILRIRMIHKYVSELFPRIGALLSRHFLSPQHFTFPTYLAPCLRLRRKCGRLSPWLIKVRPDTWPELSIPTFATPGKAVWNWGSKFHTMLWFQFQFPVCRKDAAWRLPTNAAWAVSRSVAVAAAAAYKPYTIKSLCNWLHFFTAQASSSTADRYFFKTEHVFQINLFLYSLQMLTISFIVNRIVSKSALLFCFSIFC